MRVMNLIKAGFYLNISYMRNNRASFIAGLIWPYLLMGFMLGAGMILGNEQNFRANLGAEVNPLLFFVASTFVASVSLNVMWEMGGAILFYRWVGVLPYIFVAPYRPSTILIFEYLPKYLLNSLILLTEFLPLILLTEGIFEGLLDVSVLVFAMTLGMLPLVGFAAILASFLLTTEEESNFMSWLNPLILILSGAYYPAYLFPQWMQIISQVLPTTFTLEIARLIALMNTDFRHVIFLSGVLLGMAIFYNGLSLPIIERAERKALKEGVINVY